MWGNQGSGKGNFAPLNLGASFDDVEMNRGFISLFQNRPTTEERLDFKVEFISDAMDDHCKYTHGQYCKDSGCNDGDGCTVSLGVGLSLSSFAHLAHRFLSTTVPLSRPYSAKMINRCLTASMAHSHRLFSIHFCLQRCIFEQASQGV